MPNNRQHTFFQKFIAACWILGVAFFSFGIVTSNQSNIRYMNGQANIFALNQGEGMKWLIQKQLDNLLNPTIEANAQLPVTVTTCSPLGCLPWIVDKILKVVISSFIKAILNTVMQFVKKALNDLKKAASQFNLFSNISGPARDLMSILSGRRSVCSDIANIVQSKFDNIVNLGSRPLSPLELGLKGVTDRLNATPLAFAADPIQNSVGNLASMFITPVSRAQDTSSLDAALGRIGREFDVVNNQTRSCERTLGKYTDTDNPGRSLSNTAAGRTVANSLIALSDASAKGQKFDPSLYNFTVSTLTSKQLALERTISGTANSQIAAFDPRAECGISIGSLFGGCAKENQGAKTDNQTQVNSVINNAAIAAQKTQAAINSNPRTAAAVPLIVQKPLSKADQLTEINTQKSECLREITPGRDCNAIFAAAESKVNALPDARPTTDINLLKGGTGVDLANGFTFFAPDSSINNQNPSTPSPSLNFSTKTAVEFAPDKKLDEQGVAAILQAQTQAANQGPGVQSEDIVGTIIGQITQFLSDLGNLLLDTLFSVVNTIAGNICSSLGITQACTELAAATSQWSSNLKADLNRDIQNIDDSLRGSNSDLANTTGDSTQYGVGGENPIITEQRRRVEDTNRAEREEINRLNRELESARSGENPLSQAEIDSRVAEIAARERRIQDNLNDLQDNINRFNNQRTDSNNVLNNQNPTGSGSDSNNIFFGGSR